MKSNGARTWDGGINAIRSCYGDIYVMVIGHGFHAAVRCGGNERKPMTKPYIVCHMMMSVDGRIDCGMTVKLAGNSEYYATLAALDVPTTLSGRRTAQL